jgi:hypothetical protein
MSTARISPSTAQHYQKSDAGELIASTNEPDSPLDGSRGKIDVTFFEQKAEEEKLRHQLRNAQMNSLVRENNGIRVPKFLVGNPLMRIEKYSDVHRVLGVIAHNVDRPGCLWKCGELHIGVRAPTPTSPTSRTDVPHHCQGL